MLNELLIVFTKVLVLCVDLWVEGQVTQKQQFKTTKMKNEISNIFQGVHDLVLDRDVCQRSKTRPYLRHSRAYKSHILFKPKNGTSFSGVLGYAVIVFIWKIHFPIYDTHKEIESFFDIIQFLGICKHCLYTTAHFIFHNITIYRLYIIS